MVSVAMHLVMVGLVAWGWEFAPVEKNTLTPTYVPAKIVQLNATAPKQTAPKEPQPDVVDLTKQREEQERQRRLEEQRRQQEQARRKAEEEAKRKERERQEREAAKRREQERKEAQQRQREQALADALAEEQAMLQAQQDAVVAQSYQEAIVARIHNNWSRPPSARNGMRARLKIQLVPTGRVVSVTVVESSGNAAFDRSAEQAVRKAEQFPELQEMPSRVFERHFRELFIIFEPTDLRQ